MHHSSDLKFYLAIDRINDTDQFGREKAAWKGKEWVPVSSEVFFIFLQYDTSTSQCEDWRPWRQHRHDRREHIDTPPRTQSSHLDSSCAHLYSGRLYTPQALKSHKGWLIREYFLRLNTVLKTPWQLIQTQLRIRAQLGMGSHGFQITCWFCNGWLESPAVICNYYTL